MPDSRKSSPSRGHRMSSSSVAGKPNTRASTQQMGSSPAANGRANARASYRQSFRQSQRQSTMGDGGGGGGGGGGGQLQVLDEQGVDRTPKPLLSTKMNLFKSGTSPGPGDDGNDSENGGNSDFFMDRMSNANFGKESGWYSENNSGSATPASEAEEEYDYAAQREKERKRAEQDAALAAEELANEQSADMHAEASVELTPEILNERDLERTVYIHLAETETMFMYSCPCVTVAVDSELAREVERNNARYSHLLATRNATDKYVDTECQVLDLLKKTREVQCPVSQTAAASCQATTWDIADTYRVLEESTADNEDDPKAGPAAAPNGVTLSQLTTAVARGGSYQGAAGNGGTGGGTGGGGSGAVRQSMMGGHGGIPDRGMSYAGGMHASTVYGAMSGMLPGASTVNMGKGPMVNNFVGGGDAAVAAGPPPPPPDPLYSLPGLLDVLLTMDTAIAQNIYQPKMLLYRNIQQTRSNRLPLGGLPGGAKGDDDDAASQVSMAHSHLSRAPSRSPSRIGAGHAGPPGSQSFRLSEAGAAGAPTSPQRPSSRGGGRAASEHAGSGGGGMAASEASHWPDELLQDLADLGADGVPMLELLWQWSCELTTGLNVSCMSWNKARPDLLAVGYGSLSFSRPTSSIAKDQPRPPEAGRVAFWSLKNPEFPLWTFETAVGVTAIDFALQSPNILAVGLYNGTVAIYDVKSKQATSAMESDAATGRHSDPVWKVRWLDRGPERDEALVSISTDGRVTQWSIAKGLEFSDLMKLKRVPRKAVAAGSRANNPVVAAAAAAGGEQHDAFISRHTSGMSFDFSNRDERIYIAGTEDGWIHKCSTSYNEQYLESFQGHMGPIYQLQWSPFRQDMFISASADWTTRLWQEGRESPLLAFQAANHEVNDVQWCPTNSTVFGSVTGGGKLEVWDFSLSTVKPVVQHKAACKLQCLLFSPNSPVVVCGGEDGSVSVFRHFNVERLYDRNDEQLDRLDEVIRANVMKQSAASAK